MSSVINTNVMSLNAQRNMLRSSGDLATSMERLSTGLRINSAKDDAAGLAISERMTGQIRGLNQAVRNANDGISLLQTAEGALQEVTNNLQRIRELAVQAANGTNTNEDRQALDSEVQALLDEIDQVADQTSFNGRNLLDGSFKDAVFQIGANSGQTIDIAKLTDANTAELAEVTSASVDSTETITNKAELAAGSLKIDDASGTAVDIGLLEEVGTVAERQAQVVDAINNKATETGVNAYWDEANSKIVLTSEHDITISGTDDGTGVGFDAGTGVSQAASTTTGLTTLDISSYAGADLAIKQVDSALEMINSDRATMGAMQQRFESAVASLQTQSENLSAARSQIQDADFAAETANLTRAQILQQAGTAMLAQANTAPQNVLSLLG